jgi:hypothetical protein
MRISDIKLWAKEHGFEVKKEQDDSINGATYYWSHKENNEWSGQSQSVSKLARDIFNIITDNKWLNHQQKHI